MERQIEPQVYFRHSRSDIVDLPADISFHQARFRRCDNNLVLESARVGQVYVRDFFCQSTLPMLMTEAGEKMSGNLAAAFATLSDRAASAMMA